MKIVVNLSDSIVQDYLDHVNEMANTKFKVKKLTPKQRKAIEKVFAEQMQGEMEMRTDDLSGFEAAEWFVDALDLEIGGEGEDE
jgi:hypothetical protein